ncbi:MAG: TIGR01906 family membrane protein [Peptoniphilaceae bacterium]|nr:TIGR01906 family membrane protein [Peptoniphilaceae bacterium]MDD7383576.1 TIGR01906 family membrane protein [Peptoniphilaceae bacterium]
MFLKNLKSKSKFISVLCGFLIFLLSIITAVEFQSLNYKFYTDFQIRNDISALYNIPKEKLINTISDIILFLKNGNHELMIRNFSKKEYLHMFDVFKIYKSMYIIRFIVLILIIIIVYRFRNANNKKKILKYIILSNISFSCILFLFLIFVTLNFDKLFIMFHHIFFNNNLWIMDVNRDLIMQIMSGDFFIESTVIILIVFLILQLLINLFFLYIRRKI